MKYKTSKPIQWLARAASVVMWNQFRYPQPVKDVYDVADNTFEKLKWAYRCWIHQLERAEKDSGIEDYFSGQKMEFTLPEDFQVQEEVTMSAGGDLMAVDCLTYENTPHLFDEIADFYFGADITCANLESTVFHKAPLGRNQVMGMPAKMNTSEAMLDRFWQEGAGINYFSTANNHCFDHGEGGLFATLDCLEKRGCYHSGTNRNREEQEDVLVIEKNGIRIAMLSYTFDMNGNHYENKALINEVRFNDRNPDLSLVKRHVKRAGEKKADIIVASVHWGWEFELYPHKNVIETGHKLAEMGIDVIIGGHPHVCQQMENYKGSLILYSMGDFVSYHPLTKDSRLTYVVKFRIAKGIEKGSAACTCRIHDFQILPVYILTEERADESYDCRLVPFEKVLRDTDIDGAFRYGLTQKERKDLPRLWNKVLMKILLPSNGKDLLVKTQKERRLEAGKERVSYEV